MRIIEPYCSMRTPELEKIAGIAKKGEGDEKEEKGEKEGDEAAAGDDKKTGEGGNQQGTGNNPTTNHGGNHHGGANNHHHHHGHHGHHGNHHGHHGGNLPLTKKAINGDFFSCTFFINLSNPAVCNLAHPRVFFTLLVRFWKYHFFYRNSATARHVRGRNLFNCLNENYEFFLYN